jgi:hypothetical protein
MTQPGAARAQQGLRWDVVVLIAACCAAAALRFVGIAHGLRHLPHSDEQVFVENVVQMVATGDWDHRFYTYPGLFFYFLGSGIALLGPQRWHGSDAYLLARAMVAAVGTLNVLVAYFVGRRLVGRWAGLAAAALLAVAPVSVETAHWVRPDVLLQGLGLLAALAVTRIGASVKGDAATGALVGTAAAAKFTGLLFVPSYVLARWLAPGRRRLLGFCAAGLVAVLVLLATTPFAVLHADQYRSGPVRQLQQYYPTPAGQIAFVSHLAYFIRASYKDLGPLLSGLFLVGAVMLVRSAPCLWGPLLLHPVVVHLVMASGSLVFERYILPSSGVVYLVACVPLARLAKRAPRSALVAFAIAAAFPLATSVRFSRYVAQPSAEDRALDWIEAHVPAGARLLETRGAAQRGATAGAVLGLDRRRYERLFWPRGYGVAKLALLVPHFDYVITGRGRGGVWGAPLVTVFEGRQPGGMVTLQIRVPRPETRPRYEAVAPRRLTLRASTGDHGLAALLDGDPATVWSSGRPLAAADWIEVTFDRPVSVGRVQAWLAPGSSEPKLALTASVDGVHYASIETVPGRPQWSEEQLPPFGQVLLCWPRTVRGLRLVPRAATDTPWVLTGLEVDARDPSPRPAAASSSDDAENNDATD